MYSQEEKGAVGMIRTVPRNPIDRYIGEGDRCIRDKHGKIIAWSAGTSEEDLQRILEENRNSYESIGMYDTERRMIV